MGASSCACSAVGLALLGPLLALAGEEPVGPEWLMARLDGQQFGQVLARAPDVPQSLERDNVWVAAMALQNGPEPAVELSRTLAPVQEPRVRLLLGATFRCMRLRRYDVSEKLFRAAVADIPSPRGGLEERYGLLVSAMFAGLRRHEELGIARSDPRHPVIRMMGTAFGVSSADGGLFADEVGPVPSPTLPRKARAPTSLPELGLKNFALSPEVAFDALLAIADLTIIGDPASGWRVRVTFPFVPRGLEFFVVLQGEEARILGAAGPDLPPVLQALGRRAGTLVHTGDIPAARQWIEWARESLETTRDSRWASFFALSTPEALSSVDGLRAAAASLAAIPPLGLGPAHPAQPAPGALAFTEGMTRPVLKSSPNGRRSPDYPAEAREAGVAGLLIVRCILSVEGRAEECTVVKPLASSLEREVLGWLAGSSWSPVTLQGKPQRVSYIFNFNFLFDPALARDAGPPGR
ncbi:MAG TPA: energy transducer TonB [Myxococcaceae bacterium]|nr:energy transducer TonB [Myxococcaceae bacterium]